MSMIKINDYVRTKDGQIDKIRKIDIEYHERKKRY